MKEHFYIGVDLGQVNDPTAIAVLEYSEELGPVRNPVTWAFPVHKRWILRQVERMRLGTEFSDVARRVGQFARYFGGPGRPLPGSEWYYRGPGVTLVVDATGLGSPVLEMIRKEPMRANIVGVKLTGGSGANKADKHWNVAKTELMGRLAAMVDNGELWAAGDLANKEQWLDEMESVNAETLQGNPDDMVIATALACWWARRKG